MSTTQSSLGRELVEKTDEIVQRWYEAWQRLRHRGRLELTEAALKNNLPLQVRLIGAQLSELKSAEDPSSMWKISERLDPELRLHQDVPIEEVVQEYRLLVEVVREWIKDRSVPVDFLEYSYFFTAVFELTAESVRRYAEYQAERVRNDRAQWLAGIMHQLRSPLAALAMQVELLESGPTDRGTRPAKIKQSVERIRVLTEGILRIERFDASDLPVYPVQVRPARLIDRLLADYEAEIARKGLRIVRRVDEALEMNADPDLLVDALGNLVHNAIKFTAHGEVTIECEARGPEVVFRIRDSGPGIPAHKLSSLFKQRQPGSAGGAGIGLLVAEHAARAQQGAIEAQSEVGKGSVFSLRLPRSVPPREQGPAR